MTTLEQPGKGTSSGGELPLNVTFHGVRGSTPCSCESNRRYGGNTACVAIEIPGSEPVVLDLGTGLRFFGETQPLDGTFRGSCARHPPPLGPRAGPAVLRPDQPPGRAARHLRPAPGRRSTLDEAFDEFMRPPYFPVRISDLVGDIRFHDRRRHRPRDRRRQGASPVPHVGATIGYRVEFGGHVRRLHQRPPAAARRRVDRRPRCSSCADGADLLIHDAQYTPEEFAVKSHWGHCTVDYAVHVAREAGVPSPGPVPPRSGPQRRRHRSPARRSPDRAAPSSD